MAVPDLGSVLVSLSEVFPLVVNLVFLLIALLGVVYGTVGLYGLYGVAAGEHKFTNRPVTIDGAMGKLALGSAMIVAPVLLWKFANSFVLGGDITYSMFNYGSTPRSSTCEDIKSAITFFFMMLGSFAWLIAGCGSTTPRPASTAPAPAPPPCILSVGHSPSSSTTWRASSATRSRWTCRCRTSAR